MKKHVIIRIAVLDSGLGGLSVAARIFQILSRPATSLNAGAIEIIFINCLPSDGKGFDGMEPKQRTSVFSRALEGINIRFSPDAIVLACNTLSVLYGGTAFSSRGAHPPVFGIDGHGVDLLEEFLRAPRARAIIFAAKTTVESGLHANRLAGRGISHGKIVCRACPGLIGAVERGPESTEVYRMADGFVSEALRETGSRKGPLATALLCTHFGWCAGAFYDAFLKRGTKAGILDPADRLSAEVASWAENAIGKKPLSRNEISTMARVVSKTEMARGTVRAMAGAVGKISPAFEAALKNWERVPGLF